MNNHNYIRYYRKKKGLTQSQLAKKCKAGLSTIFQLEKGKRRGSFELMSQIADALDVTMDQLRYGSVEESIKTSSAGEIPIRGTIQAGGLTEKDIIRAKITKFLNILEDEAQLADIYDYVEFKLNKKK